MTPDRNLMHLREALGSAPAEVVPMPVNEADLEAAAEDYARRLPGLFDLVHLGWARTGTRHPWSRVTRY